jgi:putative intracellular protease/amidase/YHS domain-containing protein
MQRRDFLKGSAAVGLAAAIPSRILGASGKAAKTAAAAKSATVLAGRLTPPPKGSISVAFLLSEGAVIIDFCGPWEVFHEANVPGRDDEPFHLYTVGETTGMIHATAGMKITPDYDFATAPAPRVIVIPAQRGHSDATLAWIRNAAKTADVTMSVCTGAFLLAGTGLLAGKSATTHHAAYRSLAREFPDVHVKRGARFVEDGNVASAGGLSSGIDLALRVVERYFGRDVASSTAYQMEYQGQGWMNPDSNDVYAKIATSTDAHPLCPMCEMEVDPKGAPRSVYKGKTYAFCSTDHKEKFDSAPAQWFD